MSLAIQTSLLHQRLEKFRADEVETAIYLKNGIRLTGKIVAFDDLSVVITSRKGGITSEVVIERSAIATTQPSTEQAQGR